ncbi:MAG: hypothetical protein RRY33_07810 [Alistipes sp.]
MKNSTSIILSITAAAALLFTACVDEPIFESSTGQGKITLITTWANRTAGVAIPASYAVHIGKYATTVSGEKNTFDNLFQPATYRTHIYNSAEKITVEGNIATVATMVEPEPSQVSTNQWDQDPIRVESMPGWLFSAAEDFVVEGNKDYIFTVPMTQQVRELKCVLKIAGGPAPINIASVHIMGVAQSINLDTNELGGFGAVDQLLERPNTDASSLTTTFHLLGFVPYQGRPIINKQSIAPSATASKVVQLQTMILFEDRIFEGVFASDNLYELLPKFNQDKHLPVTLEATLTMSQLEGTQPTLSAWRVASTPK